MRLDQDRLQAVLLFAGAVLFAVLGQFYFIRRRDFVWDGIIFFGIALMCFAGLMVIASRSVRGLSQRPLSSWQERGRRALVNRRAILAVVALLLNWAAARSANAQPPPDDYSISVLLWLSSLVLFLITFAPLSHLKSVIKPAVHNMRNTLHSDDRFAAELALALGLILIGLVLRMWDLGHIPPNLSGDEGTQGLWAVDVVEGRLRNPFATGWFTVPTMSFFAQAASLRLFGDSMAGLRTVSALVGTATLVFSFLYARRNFGRRVALFTLATLTFNHYHIHFSRLGSNQIADPFFTVLTLLLLTEGLRRERKSQHWFLGAGLTMGLSWYGYFGSRVIMLVIATFLGVKAIMERGYLRRHASSLGLMILVALMAASPLLLHYVNHPENLSARFNQVNFFRWLSNELNRPEHDSTFDLVVRQVWRSISAFNHTLDPTFWYRAQIPLLDFVSGILFILGFAVAVSRWRRPAMRLLLLWFGFAITFGWILTENPPSSMRMVVIAPAVAMLVGIGLDGLLTLAHWVIGGRRADWNWIGLTVLVVAALLNVYYYFVVYTPTRIYGNPTAETATALARYLDESSKAGRYLSAGQQSQPFVYFYGPPFLYYDFGAIQFIARDVPGVNVPPEHEDPDFRTQVTGPTIFAVLRERLDELDAIQARHRNGQLREFYSRADGRLMFVLYEVFQ